MAYLEGETFQIIDRWGDQWVCYRCYIDHGVDEFFVMYPPEDFLQTQPATFCVRCKNPTDKCGMFQRHYVDGAIFGKPIPDDRKCTYLELQRRWLVEATDELEATRQRYKDVKLNWKESKAKELMLQTLVESGESTKEWIVNLKETIRRKMLHG